MEYILNGLSEAIQLIISFDSEFLVITFTSLKISTISTTLTTIVAVPVGMLIAYKEFPGKMFLITLFNTLMSLPTVVIGLVVYSLISRQGPLGEYELLFTQTAIIIGHIVLIFPIMTGLTISTVRGLDKRIKNTTLALGANYFQSFKTFLIEAKYGIMAAVIAGFGRVFAEVGISMMIGGNIKNYTRTITTAIALETSKGEFAMGIALGIVLLLVALGINIILSKFQKRITV